jgi:predicted NBD/HSP70 family sugar kinase
VIGVDVVLAVDAGATWMKWGLQNRDGDMVARGEYLTSDYDFTLDQLSKQVEANCVALGARLLSFGFGVACPLNEWGVIGHDVSNMPDWAGRPLWAGLCQRFGVYGEVGNDCKMGALGAYSLLRLPLVYVGLGTGIGVALIEFSPSGELMVKPTEFGHCIIDDSMSAPQCGCGGFGHWEAFTGGKNLHRRYGREPKDMTDSHWSDVLKHDSVGLRNISMAFPGKRIVLGGGRYWGQPHRLPELSALLSSLQSTVSVPELIEAPHGMDSALHGAAYAAWRRLPIAV